VCRRPGCDHWRSLQTVTAWRSAWAIHLIYLYDIPFRNAAAEPWRSRQCGDKQSPFRAMARSWRQARRVTTRCTSGAPTRAVCSPRYQSRPARSGSGPIRGGSWSPMGPIPRSGRSRPRDMRARFLELPTAHRRLRPWHRSFSPTGSPPTAVDGWGRTIAQARGAVVQWSLGALAEPSRYPPISAAGLRAVRFSPDDRMLVTTSNTGDVAVWDLESGRVYRNTCETRPAPRQRSRLPSRSAETALRSRQSAARAARTGPGSSLPSPAHAAAPAPTQARIHHRLFSGGWC